MTIIAQNEATKQPKLEPYSLDSLIEQATVCYAYYNLNRNKYIALRHAAIAEAFGRVLDREEKREED